MDKEKFKIIQYIRELIVYIDKSMDNFPKKDIELKNRIRSNSYDLLEWLMKRMHWRKLSTKKLY